MTSSLPPVAPEVLAEAVEQLSARLRKKLDAATASCGALASSGADGAVVIGFGEDAVVTLRPGPGGAVTEAGQAVCTCLLAPRCLHRAAALGAAPLADADASAPVAAQPATPGPAEPAGPAEPEVTLTDAQLRAAAALWRAAAEALAAGVTAGGAVVQAE
ncbi:SWIM zinc finger family protein, partial [Streptomyces sp. ISL-44]